MDWEEEKRKVLGKGRERKDRRRWEGRGMRKSRRGRGEQKRRV